MDPVFVGNERITQIGVFLSAGAEELIQHALDFLFPVSILPLLRVSRDIARKAQNSNAYRVFRHVQHLVCVKPGGSSANKHKFILAQQHYLETLVNSAHKIQERLVHPNIHYLLEDIFGIPAEVNVNSGGGGGGGGTGGDATVRFPSCKSLWLSSTLLSSSAQKSIEFNANSTWDEESAIRLLMRILPWDIEQASESLDVYAGVAAEVGKAISALDRALETRFFGGVTVDYYYDNNDNGAGLETAWRSQVQVQAQVDDSVWETLVGLNVLIHDERLVDLVVRLINGSQDKMSVNLPNVAVAKWLASARGFSNVIPKCFIDKNPFAANREVMLYCITRDEVAATHVLPELQGDCGFWEEVASSNLAAIYLLGCVDGSESSAEIIRVLTHKLQAQNDAYLPVCRALDILSSVASYKNERNCMAAYEAGSVHAIQSVLKTNVDSGQVLDAAYYALLNIYAGCTRAGVDLPDVTALIQDHKDTKHLLKTCRTLGDVFAQSQDIFLLVLVLKSFRHHAADENVIQDYAPLIRACCELNRLIISDANNCRIACSVGAVEALIELIDRTELPGSNTICIACETLGYICHTNSDDRSTVAVVVPVLVRACRSNCFGVCSASCSALAKIYLNDGVRKAAGDLGVVHVLTDIIKANENMRRLKSACLALRNVCLSDDNRRIACDLGLILALKDMNDKFKKYPELLELGNSLLENLNSRGRRKRKHDDMC